MNSFLDQLAAFVQDTDALSLQTELKHHTALVMADVMGAIAAGGVWSSQIQALTQKCSSSGGKSIVLVPGLPRVGAENAALLNATAGTWLELEEGNRHARGHPGIHVMPTALALAEDLGASGNEFFNAFLVGYEVGARIGAAFIPRSGFHPHGTWGTVGAAAAAARLKKLSYEQTKSALAIASCLILSSPFAAATQGATVRNLFAGVAANNGMLAVQAAESGFSGLSDGPVEVFSKLIGDGFDIQTVTADLGRQWIIQKNYFKTHAFCRHNHAALEALNSIQGIEEIDAEQIQRVFIYTHAPASNMGHKPENGLSARFSIPYSVAARLALGISNEQATSAISRSDPRLRRILEVIELCEDKTYTARYPAYRIARVEVCLKDGRWFSGRCENPPGDTDLDPLPDEFIKKKFQSAVDSLFADAGEHLWLRLTSIWEVNDIRELWAKNLE